MGPHGPCSIAPSMPTRSGRASPHPSRRPLAPGCAPVWKRGTLPFANGLSFWCRTLTGTRSRTWSVSPSRCRSRGMSGARTRGSLDDFGARRKRPVGSNFPSDPLLWRGLELHMGLLSSVVCTLPRLRFFVTRLADRERPTHARPHGVSPPRACARADRTRASCAACPSGGSAPSRGRSESAPP